MVSLCRPLMAAQEQKFPACLLELNSLGAAERLATVQRIFKSVYDGVLGRLHPLVPSVVIFFTQGRVVM